jgi:hypothetical protein
MRISVHIEADSAEDYRAAVTALQGQILKESLPPLKEVISGVEIAATPVLEQIAKEHVPATAAEFPVGTPAAVEAPPEPAEKPVEKPKRAPRKASGNGAKAAPVEPEPRPVPSEPAQDEPVPVPGVRQDLLDAAQDYVLHYGYNFASKDIPELFQKHLGPDIRKLSEVAEADLGIAIKLVRQALAENPYNRRVLQDAA